MKNSLVTKPVQTTIPTKFGVFKMYVWPGDQGKELVALTTETLNPFATTTVRVHSECLTGDAFGSQKCDCGTQKEKSLRLVNSSKNGIFIYHRQEGRNIGLYEKIRSYKLQEKGLNTFEANLALGCEPDQREYSDVNVVLSYFSVKDIDLVTNNPSKITSIAGLGLNIKKVTPLSIKSNLHNKKYIETKHSMFKHGVKERSKYFYSVCYITQKQDLTKLADVFSRLPQDPSRLLCLGVYADISTLVNSISCKKIASIFDEARKYKNIRVVLHYSFKNTKDSEEELLEIKTALPNVDYVQLNDLKNKSMQTIKKASKLFTYVNIVITNKDIKLLEDKTFVTIARKPETFICIDNSFGKGKNESLKKLKEKVRKVIKQGINEVSVSGGFGPDTLENYFSLRNYYTFDISIDAESKLKTNGKLDISKATKYLQKLSAYSLNT
jgi:GTP cyclohydrolase II